MKYNICVPYNSSDAVSILPEWLVMWLPEDMKLQVPSELNKLALVGYLLIPHPVLQHSHSAKQNKKSTTLT